VSRPEWRLGRPELFISMDSGNPEWVLAAQLYPVHESEIPLIESKGAAEFLSTGGVNFHDPRRPSLHDGD
jgi:hypothetical protein